MREEEKLKSLNKMSSEQLIAILAQNEDSEIERIGKILSERLKNQ